MVFLWGLFLWGNNKINREFKIKLIAYADATGVCEKKYSREGDIKEYEENQSRQTGMINTRSIIATSTVLAQAESEVGAMVEATKDTIFFRNLMQDLHQHNGKLCLYTMIVNQQLFQQQNTAEITNESDTA